MSDKILISIYITINANIEKNPTPLASPKDGNKDLNLPSIDIICIMKNNKYAIKYERIGIETPITIQLVQNFSLLTGTLSQISNRRNTMAAAPVTKLPKNENTEKTG